MKNKMPVRTCENGHTEMKTPVRTCENAQNEIETGTRTCENGKNKWKCFIRHCTIGEFEMRMSVANSITVNSDFSDKGFQFPNGLFWLRMPCFWLPIGLKLLESLYK